MKTQQGHFIKLPDGFSVSVPNRSVREDDHFLMNPSGLYITYNYETAWIHYAGEEAGSSHAVFEIPSDPDFLQILARELNKFAKKIKER
jgi:hypothetical protein